MDGGGLKADGGRSLRQISLNNKGKSACGPIVPTNYPSKRQNLNVLALSGDGWSLPDAIRIGTLLSERGQV